MKRVSLYEVSTIVQQTPQCFYYERVTNVHLHANPVTGNDIKGVGNVIPKWRVVYLLAGLGVVVVPLGVAVDELVAERRHVAQRPVPLRHPVRQELEQVVNPGHTDGSLSLRYTQHSTLYSLFHTLLYRQIYKETCASLDARHK